MPEEYKIGDYVIKKVGKDIYYGKVISDGYFRTQVFGRVEPIEGSNKVYDMSNLAILIDSLKNERKYLKRD